MREEVFLIGRVLFALLLLGSGAGHLMDTEGSAEYATTKKVPSPRLLVQISGLALLLGGVAIVLGFWLDLTGLLVAVLVLIIAIVMHRFWEETDAQTKQIEMSMFMKNLSIAGGGLILASLGDADWYTITDGVF